MHSQGVSVVAKKKYTEEEARERKNARERERKASLRSEGKMAMNDENIKKINIGLSTTCYPDVLEYLETRKNKSDYIKRLIRADIQQGLYMREYPIGKRGPRTDGEEKSIKKTIGITLSKTNDTDIIELLSKVANKPAYIAKLVRRDIFKKKVGILEDD